MQVLIRALWKLFSRHSSPASAEQGLDYASKIAMQYDVFF